MSAEFVAPDNNQEEKKIHCSDNVSFSQILNMKNLVWAIGLFATLTIFVSMSIFAWFGCLLSYNDWRYADAGTNKELFRRDFFDARKDFMDRVGHRYDLVWYAFARETLNINIVTTVISLAVGYAWLLFFGRRDTKSALQVGFNVALFGSVFAAVFCLFQKSTLIIAGIEIVFAVYMFIRRKSVFPAVLGDEEEGQSVQNALEPVQRNPSFLVIFLVSLAVEGLIQLSVFACWSHWVSDWRMWFTWILSIWIMDALRMGTFGTLIKTIETVQKDMNGTANTTQAIMTVTKAVMQVLVHDLGSISSLSFLWMPLRLVGELASLAGGYFGFCLPVAEWVTRKKSPFSTVYIALRDCDCSSAQDASIKLVTNSGSSLSVSPSTVYTGPLAAEYQSLVTNAFRLIGFSLSYVASAACGIPFNVAFWICYMCSGISASIASPLCALMDYMLCYSHVKSFNA